MKTTTDGPSRQQRRREAVQLHRIEGYEFSAEQHAMFEMFDREGFTDEQRLEYLRTRARARAGVPNAAE